MRDKAKAAECVKLIDKFHVNNPRPLEKLLLEDEPAVIESTPILPPPQTEGWPKKNAQINDVDTAIASLTLSKTTGICPTNLVTPDVITPTDIITLPQAREIVSKYPQASDSTSIVSFNLLEKTESPPNSSVEVSTTYSNQLQQKIYVQNPLIPTASLPLSHTTESPQNLAGCTNLN